jgi:hypothetical protein
VIILKDRLFVLRKAIKAEDEGDQKNILKKYFYYSIYQKNSMEIAWNTVSG